MNSKSIWITLIVLFFLVGAAGSYLFMRYFGAAPTKAQRETAKTEISDGQDLMVIRLSMPKNGAIEMTERKIPRRISSGSIAEAVVEEFFKITSTDSPVPQGVKTLGMYRDAAQNLYLDLSDEVRRNFQGDALSEFILLKGLYDSLAANLQDFQDLKILVEGKEIESLGGHFYLKYPLKGILLRDPRTEGATAHE